MSTSTDSTNEQASVTAVRETPAQTPRQTHADKMGNFLLTSFFSAILYVIPPIVAQIIIFAVISAQTAVAVSTDWIDLDAGQIAFIILFEVLAVLLLYGLMRFTKETWRSIGVKKPELYSTTLSYVLIGFGIYFLCYFLVALFAFELLPIDTQQEQQIGFDRNAKGVELLLIFAMLVLFVPFVEEVIFRGFLYMRFRRAFSVVTSALFVSIIFGLLHLQLGGEAPPLWVAMIDTFILSLVLVWLREKTGTIWSGVGLHALKNGIAFYALFISTNLFPGVG